VPRTLVLLLLVAAGPQRPASAKPAPDALKFNITMPKGAQTTNEEDAYVCTTLPLPPQPMKLVGVEPLAKQEVVHHILLFGEQARRSTRGLPGRRAAMAATSAERRGSRLHHARRAGPGAIWSTWPHPRMRAPSLRHAPPCRLPGAAHDAGRRQPAACLGLQARANLRQRLRNHPVSARRSLLDSQCSTGHVCLDMGGHGRCRKAFRPEKAPT
jgi:hypothetical protein